MECLGKFSLLQDTLNIRVNCHINIPGQSSELKRIPQIPYVCTLILTWDFSRNSGYYILYLISQAELQPEILVLFRFISVGYWCPLVMHSVHLNLVKLQGICIFLILYFYSASEKGMLLELLKNIPICTQIGEPCIRLNTQAIRISFTMLCQAEDWELTFLIFFSLI